MLLCRVWSEKKMYSLVHYPKRKYHYFGTVLLWIVGTGHFLLSNVHYPKENNIKLMLFPFWIMHKAIFFLFRFYYSLFFSTFFNRRVQESEACNKTLDFIALNRVHTHNLALILPFYWGASLAISNCINHHTKANTIFQGICKRTIEVWIYCKLQIRGDTIHMNS